MLSKRTGFLTFLLWLVVPCGAFAQSSLDVSPGAIYRPPGNPSCYTISVGDAADMTVDLEFYFNGAGPYQTYGWPTLDSNGQAVACTDEYTGLGLYEYTGVRDTATQASFLPVYATLTISPAPPVITGAGSTGDNWDKIWITGAQFKPDSRVYVYSNDWSTYQIFWGPAWGNSPGMSISEGGTLITLQVTDPTVRSWFGNAGVEVLVVNEVWNTSQWRWTHSPPPVINSGGASCADLYCITLTGDFPLNATVDFRAHGQPDVIPNSYSGLNVTSSLLSLQLNSGIRYTYDTAGLDAWVVNALFPNWSWGYYLAPQDRSIIGNIDGIVQVSGQYYLQGWACAKTFAGSIDVHIYAGSSAYSGGIYVTGGTANQTSEPGVGANCGLTGSNYRFSILLSEAMRQLFGGQPIFVHGISPFLLTNTPIWNSGNIPFQGMPISLSKEYIYLGNRALAVDAP